MTPSQPSTRLEVRDSYGDRHSLPGPFASLEEMVTANRAACQHWFDPDAIRFFSCRLSRRIICGRLFISSERFTTPFTDESPPRRYTIRLATDNGEVRTVGEFQQYRSLAQAQDAALGIVR